MKRLSERKAKERCVVRALEGNERFIGRAAAMGLTRDTELEVVQNGGGPLLVYARDTMIAIGRKEAKNVLVEGVE